MTPTIIIGIDPGATWTGIVARHGRTLLAWRTPRRQAEEWPKHGVGPGYLDQVLRAIDEVTDKALAAVGRYDVDVVTAVEAVNVPSPHMKNRDGSQRLIHPKDLIGLSIVFGAIIASRDARIVAPEDHGKGMLGSYPDELVTAGERRHGVDREAQHNDTPECHGRAAWDTSLDCELTLLAPGLVVAR